MLDYIRNSITIALLYVAEALITDKFARVDLVFVRTYLQGNPEAEDLLLQYEEELTDGAWSEGWDDGYDTAMGDMGVEVIADDSEEHF